MKWYMILTVTSKIIFENSARHLCYPVSNLIAVFGTHETHEFSACLQFVKATFGAVYVLLRLCNSCMEFSIVVLSSWRHNDYTDAVCTLLSSEAPVAELIWGIDYFNLAKIPQLKYPYQYIQEMTSWLIYL